MMMWWTVSAKQKKQSEHKSHPGVTLMIHMELGSMVGPHGIISSYLLIMM